MSHDSRHPWPAAALALWCGCAPQITSLGAYDAPTGQYLEAEAGELSGGFSAREDPSASGKRCIAPPDAITSEDRPGAARASYRFEIMRADTYRIWGRMHGPDAIHNRFWFQLDGGAWRKWRLSTGNVWYWDAFHDDRQYDQALEFELSTGAHTLTIANCVDGAQLDRLYVTADGDEPVGNDTPCHPPHSIQLGSECHPSCGSQGETTCIPEQCANKPHLRAYDCEVCCFAQ